MSNDALSPCTNVCRIDGDSGWCAGCRRSLDEIAAWPTLTEEQKILLLERIRARDSQRPLPRTFR